MTVAVAVVITAVGQAGLQETIAAVVALIHNVDGVGFDIVKHVKIMAH